MNYYTDHPERRKMKSHLIEALRIAKADGIIDESELEYIYKLGSEYFITKEEVDEIISGNYEYEYYPPEDLRERFEHLHNFISMIFTDRDMLNLEIQVCVSLSVSLGYSPIIVDSLVEEIINSIKSNKTEDEVYEIIVQKFH